MEKENTTEDIGVTFKEFLVFVSILAVTIILVVIAYNLIRDGKTEREAKLYKEAVKTCGIENIQRNDYTNGNVDFNCIDYSISPTK